MQRTAPWRGWTWVNAVLGVLVLALVVYLVVLVSAGAKALPGTTKAERADNRYQDVSAAVSKEIEAFLRVDYRKMDPLMAAVVDGATGDFKQQYSATRSNLKLAAQQAQATSTGTIRQVGISDLKGDKATAFVAADSVIFNKQSKGLTATKACPHANANCKFYRLKVGMTRTSDGWKMSSLDFVS